MKRKITATLLAFMISFISFTSSVYAEEQNDGTLSVDYRVTEVSEDEGIIEVNIKNVSDSIVYDINIENTIPDAFVLDEEGPEKITSLDVQEEKHLMLKIKLKNTDSQGVLSKDIDTGDTTRIVYPFLGLGIPALLIFIYAKRNKKYKKIPIFLLAAAIGMSGLTSVKAEESHDVKTMQLQTTLNMNEQSYAFQLDITYQVEKQAEANLDKITRGEWVKRLVEAMNYETMEFALDQPYFTDTANTEVESAINYAVAYRILELEEAQFRPNEYATREFVAVTTSNALGYEPQAKIECKDILQIQSPELVEIAVGIGAMSLKDDYFYPLQYTTFNEAEQALQVVKDTKESEYVSDEEKNEVVYQDEVIVLDENINVIENEQGMVTLPVNEQTKSLKAGDIIATQNNGFFKLHQVQIKGNQIELQTSEPDITKTVKSITSQGNGTLNPEGFIPGEDVNYNKGERAMMAASPRMKIVNVEDSFTDAGKWTLKFDKELGEHVKLEGKMDIDLVGVKYKADIDVGWGGVNVNNVYLKVQPDIQFEGKITGSLASEKEDGYISLGKVPVVGIPGASLYLEIGVEYSLDGYVKVVYTLDGQFGVQVLNNRPRFINSMTSTLSTELGASVKVGGKLKGLLEVANTWDLLDVAISAGVKGSGSVATRSTGVTCSDLSAYFYMKCSIFDEGLIGDWLDVGMEKEIFDKKNSPIKLVGHYENLRKVPNCTFADATVKGNVLDAETMEPIQDATITLINTNTNEKKETKTDSQGEFSISTAGGSTFRVITRKQGYITFAETMDLDPHEVKQIQTRLAIKGSDGTTELGKAGGEIHDAVTGQGMENVKLTLRKHWGQTTGDIVKELYTDINGTYVIQDLPLGNYTVTMEKEQYVTDSFNIVVTRSGNLNQHGAMVPKTIEGEQSELRVVLTWGATPMDLDSHLVGVSAQDAFHISFMNRIAFNDEDKIADLDVDDTDSYGPETVSLYKTDGAMKYHYYIHDYTNREEDSSSQLAHSGARLSIFIEGKYKETMYIPTNQSGTLWHAFDYDPINKNIIKVNRFSYQSSPDLIM